MIPAAFALLLVAAASVDPDPGAVPLPPEPTGYPPSIRLRVPPEVLQASFTHFGGGGFSAPAAPAATAPIGQQAARAYATALVRVFREPGPGGPDLVLELVAVSAGLEWIGDGWQAVVQHRLVLRAPGGGEVGRHEVQGQAALRGLGSGAVPVALDEAAQAAAERLLETFADPPGVKDWLRARDISPAPYRARPLPVPDPTHPPVERADRLAFAELVVGVDAMEGEKGLSYGARAGISNGWGLAQLALTGWEEPEQVGGRPGTRSSCALGLDLGAVVRLAGSAEIVGGAGVETVLNGGPSSSELLPSFFATVRTARFFTLGAVRYRVGLELRRHGAGSAQRTGASLLLGMETFPPAAR